MVTDRSTREMMTVARFLFVALTLGTLIGPPSAHGQLLGGVFGARAPESFGGTNGFGAEAGVSLPMVPVDVLASGTLFRPSCTGCDLKGWSLGVRFRVLTLPVLAPFVTAGRSWRDLEDPSNALVLDDDGLFAGVGLEISFPGVAMFAEGRYDFLSENLLLAEDLRQWVLRAGLIVRWGGLPR
jgi:hypothetical protein